ncbi:MAG: DUF998 domain-containing protein [Ferruginibacter sp.]
MEIKTKALLACGAIACPLFILVFLIEGITRSGYNAVRHPVSSLSIGEPGWIQVASFIITGSLLVFFAVGLRYKLAAHKGNVVAPLLIAAVAIGLIGAGIFTTDPVYGYPADKPLLLTQLSIHGRLHVLFSIPVFLCLPAACFVFSKRFSKTGEQGWAIYSLITGIVMFATFILAGMGFKQVTGLVDFAGLIQRLCIITGWTWITLLALHSLNTGTG